MGEKKTVAPDSGAYQIPESYRQPVTGAKGTIERLDYDSKAYDSDESILKKHAYVYLPADYDSSKKYDVFFLLHGGGGEAESWFRDEDKLALNLIDHMFEDGLAKDLIIVTPSFYHGDETDKTPGNGRELVYAFHKELRNDLIPAVESKYSTWQSRDHRAFAGLSMGSMTTYRSALENGLDLIAWFGAYSGCAGPDADNRASADEILEAINVKYADYDIKYFLACNGTADIAHDEHVENMKYVLAGTDKLKDGVNYQFIDIPGAEHCFEAWVYDLYESLKRFFK